jgi:Di-haem oxidoreductase, putative peroxidase
LPRRGYTTQPRGFNPGNRSKPHRALKGRHIDWLGNVKKTMYAPSVSAHTSHDGRAQTVMEAILMHGGEATIIVQRFSGLPAGQQQDIIAFLNSI